MNDDDRLEQVLSRGALGSVAQQLLAALRAGMFVKEQLRTRPLPLQQVRDIYGMRAQLNPRRGGAIEGYDDLLASLDTFACDSVVILSFQTSGPQYLVFADAQTIYLAGVLKLPPKRADSATLPGKVA